MSDPNIHAPYEPWSEEKQKRLGTEGIPYWVHFMGSLCKVTRRSAVLLMQTGRVLEALPAGNADGKPQNLADLLAELEKQAEETGMDIRIFHSAKSQTWWIRSQAAGVDRESSNPTRDVSIIIADWQIALEDRGILQEQALANIENRLQEKK